MGIVRRTCPADARWRELLRMRKCGFYEYTPARRMAGITEIDDPNL